MAGGRLEVSADVRAGLGARRRSARDGIVYFDPFRYEVDVYARSRPASRSTSGSATITLLHLASAPTSTSRGPKFHGEASFDVGPVRPHRRPSASPSRRPTRRCRGPSSCAKYLEEAAEGVARVVTAITGRGALPPGTGPGGATDTGTADGTAAKPFEVFAEFEIMVTTAVPNRRIDLGATALALTPSSGPGHRPDEPGRRGHRAAPDARRSRGRPDRRPSATSCTMGRRSRRACGACRRPSDDHKIPAGDVIEAIDGVRLFDGGRHPGRAASDRLSPDRDGRPAAAALRQRGLQPHGPAHRGGQGPGRAAARPTPATRACSRPARSGWRPARVRAPRRWRRCTASATRRRASARSPTGWRPRPARDARSRCPRPARRSRSTRSCHARGRRCPDLDRGRSRSVRRAHHGQGRPRRARQRRRRRSPACRPRWTCPCPRSCIASAASRARCRTARSWPRAARR